MKLIYTFFLALALCAFVQQARAQWVHTIANAGQINDISASGDTVFAASALNGLYRSTDNGAHWDSVTGGLLFSGFNCVLINNGKIYLGTAGSNGSGSNGGIYVSNNNGSSWDTTQPGVLPAADYIKCFVAGNGCVFAGTGFNGVYCTTNDGASWQAVNNGLLNATDGVNCMAASGNTAYLGSGAASGNVVYTSNDKGGTWTQVNNPAFMIQPGTWVQCVGANASNVYLEMFNGGGMYHSNDNGGTWDTANTGFGIASNSVQCIATGSNGYVFAGAGNVYYSSNNGAVWDTITGALPANQIFQLAVNGKYVFAGTDSGVWRRPLSDYGATAVNEPQSNIPSGFSLSQNYPNPFSAATTISFSLSESAPVTLSIYNSLGEVIATLANGEMTAGQHSAILHGEHLQNGMYFYRLTAGKFSQSGEMAVVK